MESLDPTHFSQPFISQEPPQSVEYAGFWRRFGAYFIDSIIFGVIISIVSQVIGAMMGGNITQAIMTSGFGPESTEIPPELIAGFGDLFFVLFLVDFILSWLYFAGFESSSMQGTPGKRVLGMKVTDVDGEPISFGTATGRYLGKFLSGLLFSIGYIMAAFTSKKQALHDMIAGTLVILRNQ